jgi:predicted HicB family RNase H-like nuclease
MLPRLLEWFRTLLFLSRDVQESTKDIAELRQELNSLADTVAQLQSEMQRGFENERHEREKFMLRVENALLRFERSLPPSKSKRRK